MLGILPRFDDGNALVKTGPVNTLLAARFSGTDYVTFRDFGAPFLNQDGTPNTSLFSDGVHINARGYNRLGMQIRPELMRLLGQTSEKRE